MRVDYLLGLGRLEDRFVLLLDIDRVLSAAELLRVASVEAAAAERPARRSGARRRQLKKEKEIEMKLILRNACGRPRGPRPRRTLLRLRDDAGRAEGARPAGRSREGPRGEPGLVKAVVEQNEKGPIAGMDNEKWKAMRRSDDLVKGFTQGEAGKLLTQKVEGTDGLWVRAFLSGAKGEKVAFTEKTISYLHAGQPKFDVPVLDRQDVAGTGRAGHGDGDARRADRGARLAAESPSAFSSSA